MSVDGLDLCQHRPFFFYPSFEDSVGMIDANHGTIRRYDFNFEVIDFLELIRLAGSRSRHAAHRLIQADEILHRNRAQDSALTLRIDAFLRFYRRVKTARPPAILRDTAFELVDGFDGAILHEVVHITAKQVMRMERILNRSKQVAVAFKEKVSASESLLQHSDAGIREGNVAPILLKQEVFARPQHARHAIDPVSQGCLIAFTAGNDERNPGLIDQDRVHLVHKSDRKGTMNLVVRIESQLVAKIVESNFVRRAVGDVTGIGALPVLRCHALLDAAYG